jgi:hypothetical protein
MWLTTIGSRTYGYSSSGDIALLGAGLTFFIAATFIHGLRSKFDELIAALSNGVPKPEQQSEPLQFPDEPAAPIQSKAERDAAWLVRPKSKS